MLYYQLWYLLGVDLVRLPLALEEKDIHDVELLLHIAHALLQLLKPRLDSGARVQVGGAGRDRLYKKQIDCTRLPFCFQYELFTPYPKHP